MHPINSQDSRNGVVASNQLGSGNTSPPGSLHLNNTASPQNLTALLCLSSSLHANGKSSTDNIDDSTCTPKAIMNQEKISFLSEAINFEIRDVPDHLRNLIRITYLQQGNESPDEVLMTLDSMLDILESIDNAKVFYQVGGLQAMKDLLEHNQPSVRTSAARIIALCCQNNPFCQDITVQNNTINLLLEMGKNDDDFNARFCAFSVISALVRNNPEGLKQFKSYDGLAALKDGLKTCHPRITSKISFFITYLCNVDDQTKEDLVDAGITEELVQTVLKTKNAYSVEALVTLMTVNNLATKQARQHQLELKDFVTKNITDEDANCDDIEFCKKLEKILDEIMPESGGAQIAVPDTGTTQILAYEKAADMLLSMSLKSDHNNDHVMDNL